MIVIGADTHKSTHNCAAVVAGTGQLVSERTERARKAGFAELLDWSRGLEGERIWALEDCRHVSGAFERFLVARGERVVRVAPKLMGESRKGARERGKSDAIDATAVARAALRHGPQTLPCAHLDERSLEIPAGALDRSKWLKRVARKLGRAEQGARVRVARELVAAIRARTRRAAELESELATLVAAAAPQLLELKGCGTLTAAKLLAETAGAAKAYLTRKPAEGKNRMEALRCLKRHLARVVLRSLKASTTGPPRTPSPARQRMER